MYDETSETKLEWVSAVPGDIPNQSVIYEDRSHGDAMYVVKVIDGSETEGGLYETNKSCAEYVKQILVGQGVPKCVSTFEFLVLKQGRCYATLSYTAYTAIILFQGRYSLSGKTSYHRIVKSRSREIGFYTYSIALKFDRYLLPVKLREIVKV